MRAETGIKKAEGVGVEPTGDDTSRLPTVLKTARATGPYPLPGLLYGYLSNFASLPHWASKQVFLSLGSRGAPQSLQVEIPCFRS